MSVAATYDALGADVWRHWLSAPVGRTIDWLGEHVRMPGGEPFDLDLYPHIGAPGGPAEAFDDSRVRTIVLQWATRLGKTAFGLSLMLRVAASMPAPMMFGTSTDKLAMRIVAKKIYPMYERCGAVREQILPEHRRTQQRIDFRDCSALIAWSGSPTMLADSSAWFQHANEVDKWSTESSAEGDTLKLFLERSKEFPTRKVLIEGTPTKGGHSRLERYMKGAEVRHYYVPCPKCGHYQRLKLGEKPQAGEKHAGGVVWDSGPDGHSDPNRAYETACYVCERCGKASHDEQRASMMRGGVWAPAGGKVSKQGRVSGGAVRSGPDVGYQLSSLYALSLGWGDIAREFLQATRPRELQNFVNSWLGEVWERKTALQTWEALGERLTGEHAAGVIPVGGVFLTAGVDKQMDHYVYWIHAMGEGARHWLVAYGVAHTEDDLAVELQRGFPREDGGPDQLVRLTLIDSGYKAHEVYKLCQQLNRPALGSFVIPLKGENDDLRGPEPFRRRQLSRDKHKTIRRAGLAASVLYISNRKYWEEVVDAALNVLRPGDGNSLTLCDDAVNDRDLLEQLLNGVEGEEGEWEKASEEIPDDYRAAYRYALTAGEVWTRRKWGNIKYRQPVTARPVAKSRRNPPPDQPESNPGNQWLRRTGL